MAAQLFYLPFDPVFTSRGLPAGAAQIYLFYSGTTTIAPIYADGDLSVRLPNPLSADGLGRLPAFYLDDAITYRLRVVDATGAQIGDDADPYVPGKERAGPAGPADNTYTALVTFKASDIGRQTASLVGIPNVPDGRFNWTLGNYTGQADDVNIIKADSTALSVGAWVRQRATGIAFDGRSADAKLRETVSVTDTRFAGGAKGDGTTDDTAAINAALAGGGRVVFPKGVYKISDRLLVTVARTQIVLEAGTTITGNPWRYPGGQLPFGSLILITAADCTVTGAGMGSSLIQLTGGSEANAITFLHTDGGAVSDLTLDGGMSGVTAVEDDTFMTGINVLNASVSRPAGTKWTRVPITRVEARNWAQYGLQAYGDLSGADFTECWVHNNGIATQTTSRGAGIAITRGNRRVRVSGCTIEDNKQDGIFQTSAGLASRGLSFTNNLIQRNGRWGITCTEEANYASVANQGTNGITISGNTIRENGGGSYPSTGGLRVGTYDNVGPMLNVTSTGDLIQDNYGFGCLLQTNDVGNRLMYVTIDSRIIGSTGPGLGVGAKMDSTVRWNGTKIRNNTGADIDNSGDSRLVSNSRGYGGEIASASTITLPRDGDSFTLTGSTTINNIAHDEGRVVTLVFGGSITVSNTGNIAMANAFAGAGNAALQLVSRASGWIAIARSMNV